MSKVAKIGIVGSGIFGQMHLKAFTQLQNEGKVELAAIADIVEEKPEDRLQTDAFINVGYAVYNLVLTALAVLHWGKNDPLYYIAGVVGIMARIGKSWQGFGEG